MFVENVRVPITLSLFPPIAPPITGYVDLKLMIKKHATKQGRRFDINHNNDKITLSNYAAIRVLKDVNHGAKIIKYLFHPLTLFTITTLSVIPLFFTSVAIIRIALVIINNVGLWNLVNEARFKTNTQLSHSYKRIEECTSTLITALESETENFEIE